jgi:hypothetical protein
MISMRRRAKRSQGTVRRHHVVWRELEGLPLWCNEESCVFYTEPLVWKKINGAIVGFRSCDRACSVRIAIPN